MIILTALVNIEINDMKQIVPTHSKYLRLLMTCTSSPDFDVSVPFYQ